MGWNWRKFFNIVGKAAEVAAPIVSKTVDPKIGAILNEGGEILDKTTTVTTTVETKTTAKEKL